MIYLTTGLPGAGKTLYTLYSVKQRADKEKRQVYYFNIPDVNIPEWIELTEDDFKKWYELPVESIIVGDEVQRVFRPRAAGSAVPECVSKLETHRHLGVDIYLITQHPGLIDNNVRKLVGHHRHVVRAFGAKHAVVHSWNQCKDNCDKSRKDSQKEQFRYPKEVFTWYKSAEAHTHKMQLPWRIFILLGIFVVIPAAGYFAFTGLTKGNADSQKAAVNKALGIDPSSPGAVTSSAPFGPAAYRDKPKTREEYIEAYTPRLDGFVHSAPVFDLVTQPIEAPYPVGCIQTGTECTCVTQSGIVMSMAIELCRSLLTSGFHRHWQAQVTQTVTP